MTDPAYVRARTDSRLLRAGRAYRVLGVLTRPHAGGWDRAYLLWAHEGKRCLVPDILVNECNPLLYEAQQRERGEP